MRHCSVEGCDGPTRGYGMCNKHYQRWRRHGDPLAGRDEKTAKGEPLRYLNEVVMPYRGDDCLVWPFVRCNGYGQIWRNGRMRQVSAVICEELYGPAPSVAHEAAHNCGKGNSGCVTPSHVRWATHIENMADREIHGTVPIGEAHPGVKLTEADVREIRMLAKSVAQSTIAAYFGITPGQVGHIVHRRLWKHAV